MTYQEIQAHSPPWEPESQYDYPNKRRALPTSDKINQAFASTELPLSFQATAAQLQLERSPQSFSPGYSPLVEDQVYAACLSSWEGGSNSFLSFENYAEQLQSREPFRESLQPENTDYLPSGAYKSSQGADTFWDYQSPFTSSLFAEGFGTSVCQPSEHIPGTPGPNAFTSSSLSPLVTDRTTAELDGDVSCTVSETADSSRTPTPKKICFGVVSSTFSPRFQFY